MTPAILLWARGDLRRRRRSALALALMTAVVGVVPLAAAAGARRTADSLARMREELRPRHLDVQFHEGPPPVDVLERLARLPGVANVGEVANVLARPRGSDRQQFESFGQGGLDAGLGQDFDRPRLETGRPARAADEVMVSSRLARDLNLGIGDTLVLQTYREAAVERIFEGGTAGYDGPEIPLRVVGVGRQPEELTAGDASPTPLFVLAPPFFRAWDGEAHFFRGIFAVRLADGGGIVDEFAKAARGEFSERPDLNVHVSEEDARIEDAVSTQTTALALLAFAASVSAIIVLGQAVSRFSRSLRR